MTTLTHPTLAALLEAIRAEPDDDTPRLALADWLDEGADPPLAELIRVQVELVRMVGMDPECPRALGKKELVQRLAELGKGPDEAVPCKDCWPGRDALHARQSVLLREHEGRWRRGEKCERCENGRFYSGDYSRGITCRVCRGTGWSRWWLAERCSYCVGSGHGFSPASKCIACQGTGWRHRVHFVRGFPEQVDANLADIFRDDKPTEWALAVVRGEPGLRRFGVVDRPAYQRGDLSYTINCSGVESDGPENLEVATFDRAVQRYGRKTAAAANTALATAACQCVREQISG